MPAEKIWECLRVTFTKRGSPFNILGYVTALCPLQRQQGYIHCDILRQSPELEVFIRH